MRNLVKLLVASAAVAMAPAAAQAATIMPGNPTGVPGAYFNVSGDTTTGPASASFGRAGLPSGTFTDMFTFTVAQMGLGSGAITSIQAGANGSPTDLDFLEVTFSNGVDTYDVPLFSNGFESGGLANIPLFAGVLNTLSVTYLSRGEGAFGGTLAFAPAVSAIPEPATWAMMIIGFGAVGVAMRRRRKDQVRVSYAC